MNTQETANPQEEAQKIWDQLDAEDKGEAHPSDNGESPNEHLAPANHTEAAPANKADANASGAETAPTSESVLMDKIAGLETILGQVTQRLRNAEGHIGGLGSQMKQQLHAAQQVTSKGGEAPTAGEIRAAQSNAKAMESLKRDYPEFAEAMEAALSEQMQALRPL